MVGGFTSSARPEQLYKISKIRVLLKNYARDATPPPPLTSKSISIENLLKMSRCDFGGMIILPAKNHIIAV